MPSPPLSALLASVAGLDSALPALPTLSVRQLRPFQSRPWTYSSGTARVACFLCHDSKKRPKFWIVTHHFRFGGMFLRHFPWEYVVLYPRIAFLEGKMCHDSKKQPKFRIVTHFRRLRHSPTLHRAPTLRHLPRASPLRHALRRAAVQHGQHRPLFLGGDAQPILGFHADLPGHVLAPVRAVRG